jgi:signal transduction histidine kinase
MTSDLAMAGSYNYGLVALSILIAMLGSYATIDLAGRVKASHGGSRLSWRIGGATAMAIGTWAMHYTGMLAFRLPVPIRYDWPTALLSFLPSLLASAVALVVVIRPKMESRRAFVASFFIGGGIAALHYTAMASMRFQGMDHFSTALVTLSVLLAMLFALLSVWLTFLFRDGPRGRKLQKVGSVALMGTAIWAMHYTGMASASYSESATAPDLAHSMRISTLSAVGIGAVALMVLGVALLTSTWDRLEKQRSLLKDTSEQLRALSARLQSAREEEGTRIAREIHDELGGALTGLKWDLESLDQVISELTDQSQLQVLREKIEAMLRLSETTISAMRRISSELRPSILDDFGLAEAIEWQARQFQARTRIICHCECSVDTSDLNREQSTAVFRIFQEALTNILRHAQATRVDVAIREETGEIVLTVSDNGRGITEADKSRLQSLGLLGMQERAHLIGGEIDITGVEGKGTVLTVRVPISGRSKVLNGAP